MFPHLESVQAVIIFQSRRVREQMAHGEVRPRGGGVGEKFREPVVHGKFSILDQQENGGGGELLRHRTNLKHRSRIHGRLPFQIRHAAVELRQGFSIADDEARHARDVMRRHFRLEQRFGFTGDGVSREQRCQKESAKFFNHARQSIPSPGNLQRKVQAQIL